MKNGTLESLQNTQRANEWMRIFNEATSLEEMLMASYLKACEPVNLRLYAFQRIPPPPKGFHDAMQDYSLVSIDNRSRAWKNIMDRFKDYLKVVDETKAQNASNLMFLREMEKFFGERNMPLQKGYVCQEIYTHES